MSLSAVSRYWSVRLGGSAARTAPASARRSGIRGMRKVIKEILAGLSAAGALALSCGGQSCLQAAFPCRPRTSDLLISGIWSRLGIGIVRFRAVTKGSGFDRYENGSDRFLGAPMS